MKKLQFKKEIKASAEKVYETMLGLKDKATYEFWVKVFNPTSTYEGEWSAGSKIRFIGTDENGKRAGMFQKWCKIFLLSLFPFVIMDFWMAILKLRLGSRLKNGQAVTKITAFRKIMAVPR